MNILTKVSVSVYIFGSKITDCYRSSLEDSRHFLAVPDTSPVHAWVSIIFTARNMVISSQKQVLGNKNFVNQKYEEIYIKMFMLKINAMQQTLRLSRHDYLRLADQKLNSLHCFNAETSLIVFQFKNVNVLL